MKSVIFAALTGALFALGLAVAGMTSPARVTGFLDVTGKWDLTLAFVMGGAILVHMPIVRLVRGRQRPLFESKFYWPGASGIDWKLVAGAALFGIGWGLSGYCPGPALVSIAGAAHAMLVFVPAMLLGIALTRVVQARAR